LASFEKDYTYRDARSTKHKTQQYYLIRPRPFLPKTLTLISHQSSDHSTL